MKTCKSCFGGGRSNIPAVYFCMECKGTGVKPEEKAFDIERFDFSSMSCAGAVIENESTISIVSSYEHGESIYLNKADAIAIAKALGVTGDDL